MGNDPDVEPRTPRPAPLGTPSSSRRRMAFLTFSRWLAQYAIVASNGLGVLRSGCILYSQMGAFTDEMRVAVAAANDYIRRKVERCVAAGHSSHFMAAGRYFERTRDGVFELVQIGEDLVRSH